MYHTGIFVKISKCRGKLEGVFQGERRRQPLAVCLEDVE
jgi:hypothetical protein